MCNHCQRSNLDLLPLNCWAPPSDRGLFLLISQIALICRLFFPGQLAAGGELCDSAARAGCPRKRIAIGTEIETYEFMNVPQICGSCSVDRFFSLYCCIAKLPLSFGLRLLSRIKIWPPTPLSVVRLCPSWIAILPRC